MVELKSNQLLIKDGDGQETLCEIIFTFDSEATGKKYVVFQPKYRHDGYFRYKFLT